MGYLENIRTGWTKEDSDTREDLWIEWKSGDSGDSGRLFVATKYLGGGDTGGGAECGILDFVERGVLKDHIQRNFGQRVMNELVATLRTLGVRDVTQANQAIDASWRLPIYLAFYVEESAKHPEESDNPLR